MQYLPAPYEHRQGIHARQADVTFCEFMESDPNEWNVTYLNVIEEYMTCFGENDLLRAGRRRGEIKGVLVGVGNRYNNSELMTGIWEARVSIFPNANQIEPVSLEEREAIDEQREASLHNSQFLAKLRFWALEALKKRDIAAYEVKKGLWLQNYDRIKYIFELKIMKILSPPVFICVSDDYSQNKGNVKIIQDRSLEQLNHMYRDLYFINVTAEGGYQKQSFLQRWLADETKKTYATCAFDPQGTLPGNFNTFFGFRAESLPPPRDMDQATVQLRSILNHIKEVFCNDDENHADYIFKWFSNIIKYPWKKTEVLILVFGIEGCGKGIIIDFFAHKVLGQHLSFQTASPGVDLFGKFAVGSHRKLLCFCDEAGDDMYKHHDQLKNLITSKTIRIEKKGQDIRTEDNYTNIIVASNNAGPVRISPHDRRVVAFQCSDKYKGNYNYFSTLAEATNNDECARLMYEFLRDYDLRADYNFQATRPITGYYEMLQIASLPIFWRFWSFKCLTVRGPETAVFQIQARTLFREFSDWKTEGGYDHPYTEARFGKEINELIQKSDLSGVKRLKKNVIVYEIRFDKLQSFLIQTKKFDENAF